MIIKQPIAKLIALLSVSVPYYSYSDVRIIDNPPIIHLNPYIPTGDPYVAPDTAWSSIDGNSTWDGLLSDGSKTLVIGSEVTEINSQMRAVKLTNNATYSISSVRFENCYYYRQGQIPASGAAIVNYEGTLNLTDCDFTNNRVVGYDRFSAGGAIASGSISSTKNNCFLNIDNCTFTNNVATVTPTNQHSAQGGAIYTAGQATISNSLFIGNSVQIDKSKTGNLSAGGAIAIQGNTLILNSSFVGNYAKATEGSGVAGGAIFVLSSDSYFSGCSFESNYVDGGTNQSYGGALAYWGTTGTHVIEDCSFTNNYNMSSGLYGGAIFSQGPLTIIASAQDVLFQGNKIQVSQVENDVPVDGVSNAITMNGTAASLRLEASAGKKIIFNDSLLASKTNTDLTIASGPAPTRSLNQGEVIFGDGITVQNFAIYLEDGSLSLGHQTSIHGTIDSFTGTTLIINGFTSIQNGEDISLTTGIGNGTISQGGYNVLDGGDGNTHTILINMNDDMVNATNENPVWNFMDGSSLQADAGTLSFILDVSNITDRTEELHPYIFSHTESTDITKESVAGASSVTLIDSDGWTWEFETYTVNGVTYDKFDFLSGQFGIALPSITFKAPEGLGGNHVNTLWTTVRSLSSFMGTTQNTSRHYIDTERKTAFWITGLGNYFTQENQGNSLGYKYRSLGYAAGAEHTFNKKWLGGVSIGDIKGDHDVSNSFGRIDKDALLGVIYSQYTHEIDKDNTLNINTQLGYEYSRNKGAVRMSHLVADKLDGKWNDQAWILEAKAVWNHALSNSTSLASYMGLQYASAYQNDYIIKGEKNSFNVCDGRMYELKALLGTTISHRNSFKGHQYVAYASAGIAQTLSRETPRARLEGQKYTWTALGSKPGRTAATSSCGATFQISKGWSANMNYSLEVANKSLMQTGSASLIYEF